jgi:hypothetical protein
MVLFTINTKLYNGVICMLGTWRPHAEYQSHLIENLLPVYSSDSKRVEQYSQALSKLYILDLDSINSLFEPLFSNTGKPSNQQPEIFRSFVLMSELKVHSIPKWVDKLNAEDILRHMIGVDPEDVPGVGSHYDFIDRLWLENPDVEQKRQDSLHPFKRKPRKKLGKNEKQPPRHPGIIQKFVDLALQGKTFESRPELLIQQIFAKAAVEPSAKEGLLGDTQKLRISGDGTCIETGGSPFGNKVCDCVEKGNYNCDCWRKFSDTDARHGWDSYHEEWFYGHCGYFLSVYNQNQKRDLPIYLRMVQAQRYDGVSAIVALAEARKLYPQFTFDKFIGDCAHDNYPTYHLLNEWNTKAVIPLNQKNKGNFKYQPPIEVDKDGRPICIGGFSMIPVEFQKDRCRIKNRCPLKLGKIDFCPCKDLCSPSDYGRTIYTKPEWDLRLFTAIPRNSEEWKEDMKTRTTSERVNKRILNDYELEKAHARGKKRWCWWLAVHSINIHLDARIKNSKFNFISILEDLVPRAA